MTQLPPNPFLEIAATRRKEVQEMRDRIEDFHALSAKLAEKPARKPVKPARKNRGEQVMQPLDKFECNQFARLLVETRGADHEDVEHVISSGVIGQITKIELLPHPQGFTYYVSVPVPGTDGGRSIETVFDEKDGPITSFLGTL